MLCVCVNCKQTHDQHWSRDQHRSRILDIKSNSPTHHYILYLTGWGAGWVNLNIHHAKRNFMFIYECLGPNKKKTEFRLESFSTLKNK